MTIASGLKRAYGACEALARSHYENFPVASRLLPAAMRPHVAAVYAFARVADDIADEGTTPAAERLEHLGAWQQRLHAAIAIGQSAAGSDDDLDGLIVRAVAHTVQQLDLPLFLFDDLVSAFGQDTMTTRYDSWRELFDYCRRSANPIGRLLEQFTEEAFAAHPYHRPTVGWMSDLNHFSAADAQKFFDT